MSAPSKAEAWGALFAKGASMSTEHAEHSTTEALAKRFPREWHAWKSAHSRCYTQSDKDYPRYGGRGVTVCDEWRGGRRGAGARQGGFARFLRDMGACPEGKMLGRRDTSGPFSPDNCLWVTLEELLNNRESNHAITIKGVTLTAAQWAREVGLPRRQTVTNRIAQGWHPTVAVLGHVGESKEAAHKRLKIKPTTPAGRWAKR